MNTKLIIIIGFSYLYGFFEIFMNLRQRRKSTVASSGDKGSLWLLYMLITLGYILSFSNWLSVVLMITPVLLGYIYRIRVEERFMIEQIGQKYIDYQKRTKRLIPMVW